MESLKEKIALVTGAGKGIGRAIAIALANEGVHVALLARTASDLEKVALEVRAAGVKAMVVTANIADIQSVNAAVEKAKRELGPIDILINNA